MSGFSMKIARALVIGTMSAGLTACTTTGGYFSPVSSTDAARLDSAEADAIAGDMVAKLAEHVGPGTGTIALKSDNSEFAASLDRQLRGWGYAVDPAATGAGAIPLAYTVDTADGQVLARLSTPGVELARTYSTSTGIATPSSPLSVMRRAES